MTSTRLLHQVARRCFWGLLVSFLLGGSGWALMTFQPNDGNVRWVNDVHRSTSTTYASMSIATGDFDGDRVKDVVLSMKPYGGRRTLEILLGPFSDDSTFSKELKFSVQYRVSSLRPWMPYWVPSLVLADLTGDGRADLIIGRKDNVSGFSQVDILHGHENPKGVVDLDTQVPDCRITGVSQVAAGDFDGDGQLDLMMCQPETAICYLGLGGTGIFSGTFALPGTSPFHRIQLQANLTQLYTGDFNGDKKNDFIFSPLSNGTSEGLLNEVEILFGKGGLPTTPSATALSVYTRIQGKSGNVIEAMGAADLTGDGRDELIIRDQNGSTPGAIWAMDGVSLDTNTANVQQNTPPFHLLCIGSFSSDVGWAATDFDKDGASDFFPSILSNRRSGYLTSELGLGGLSLDSIGGASLEWLGQYSERIAANDMNGDGYGDLVVYEDFESLYPPYGALRMLFGFRPLNNPTLEILPNSTGSPRVSLSLAVKGDPVLMSLSGDIQDDFKDTWIPFRPLPEVTLSPKEGAKSVSVTFKNAVGRVSVPAVAITQIQAQNAQVVSGTNRLRAGGEAVFDCHVLTPGRLGAKIFGSGGTLVKEWDFGSVDPGIYPLRWEGRNSSGQRVSRGVYFLVVESNDGQTRKEILVE